MEQMMDIKQQVCSLELAKRLKELGVKQDGYFYWWNQTGTDFNHVIEEAWDEDTSISYDRICSAFTVAELGEMLPKEFFSFKTEEFFIGRRDGGISGMWSIVDPESTHSETEADARAKMLIYLIERELVKL